MLFAGAPAARSQWIGDLGLSTGAETLLQAAAQRDDLRGLVGRLRAPALLIAAT